MDPPGPTSGATLDDIREFFRQLSQPGKPATATQVAEDLSCPQEPVRCRLTELADRGELRSTQVEDTTKVWWQPVTHGSDGPEETDDQFGAFVSAVKDYAIFMLEPDGTIASWNEGAERIKGYAKEEIIGGHFSTFYTEKDRAEGVPERNLQLAESEGRVEDEGWRVRADGSRFWANVTITAIRGDSGELRGFTKVTRDMTERREYEQQLEEQAERVERQRNDLEEELDDIFERIDDAFYALDEEFRFEYVNDRAAEYLGTPAGELLGRHIQDAIEIESDNPLLKEFESALATQEQRNFERYSNVFGIWEVVRIYPSPSGLSVYFRDITERKERERELERTHDLLERTGRIADVAGWEVDPDTMEPFWSNHLFDLLDVDYEEQPTLEEALNVYLTEEDRATVEGAVEEALKTGDPFDVEVRFPRPIGDVGWLRVQGAPEMGDEEVVLLRGAVQDITERKRREQRLEELVERLETSNERLEQFAYAASHDLQEPLRMVSSYLQLIEDRYADAFDEDGEEFLAFAVDGADRMREMIDGLLEYSRVESRGDPFEPVDLGSVFSDVRGDLQVQIEEHDAEIAVGDLPRVEGDPGQLHQLFQNLLKNAIEYSGDEPARVQVSAERAGSECRISIQDEGIGIEPGDQDRIFEIFQRLHSRDEYTGTGIGLALCKRIVERHGGDITVDSEPGEGATFTVTLPVPDDN